MTFPVIVPDPPAVEVERDPESRVTYLEVGGLQVALEDTPSDVVLVTLALPVELLSALRALLTHPQVSALLNVTEATAHPPVA